MFKKLGDVTQKHLIQFEDLDEPSKVLQKGIEVFPNKAYATNFNSPKRQNS